MALVNQISQIVADSVNDALGGASTLTQPRSTSDFVSMGEALSSANAYDRWFGSLVNRIVQVFYAVRAYEAASRGVLRDEDEFGAFKEKVHYNIAGAVDNPAFKIPTISGNPETRAYTQSSPYGVNTTLGVKVLTFGGQGTWSIEVIRPAEQVKSAFTNAQEMAQFIDGIYVYIENSIQLQIEAVEALADNTGIALTVLKGKKRNLLTEYNAATGSSLTADKCLQSAAFLRFAGREIRQTLKYMERMTTIYNIGGMPKFTPSDRVVVEMLSDFTSATLTNMESDTFHNEMVSLPGFIEIPFWQTPGASFNFADTSKISIQNDELIQDPSDDSDTGSVEQSGVLAFVKDRDAIAANFGYRRSWEVYNERDDVFVHGEQARKGYAVDPNENMCVFYVSDTPYPPVTTAGGPLGG